MRVIWKAVLRLTDTQELEVPEGTEFICAREQNGQVCVWFLCRPAAPRERRTLVIAGTGHAVPSDGQSRYIGTAFMADGAMVWHVFEKI